MTMGEAWKKIGRLISEPEGMRKTKETGRQERRKQELRVVRVTFVLAVCVCKERDGQRT